MMSHNLDRKYQKDGIDYCYCLKHEGYEPCSEFALKNKTITGFHYYCRKCINSYQLIRRDKVIRYKIEDGVEMCLCSKHEEFHPCDDFQRTKGGHGYQYNCREITKIYNGPRSNDLARIKEKEQSMEMLTLLGYDTKSEIPIYQQFEIKHQL
jgi:hypothetical protein